MQAFKSHIAASSLTVGHLTSLETNLISASSRAINHLRRLHAGGSKAPKVPIIDKNRV